MTQTKNGRLFLHWKPSVLLVEGIPSNSPERKKHSFAATRFFEIAKMTETGFSRESVIEGRSVPAEQINHIV